MKNDYEKPAVTATLTDHEVFGGEELIALAWSKMWANSWNNDSHVPLLPNI